METKVLAVHMNDSHDPAIQEAIRLLQAGEVVAIPTETVYGLAANALDADMVSKIFEAKGRPAGNPLIVHVSTAEHARELVAEWTPNAQKLADAFWPGPLTLVLKKSKAVPDIVTAGGDTVAIRCPVHPIALSIIDAVGYPLAAPSANMSGYISPTTAAHVAKSLSGRIPLILDGGPCEGGIESTVVNLSGDEVEILRPGAITADMLSDVLGTKVIDAFKAGTASSEILLSPGQLETHYAPATSFFLVQENELLDLVADQVNQGKRAAVMSMNDLPTAEFPADGVRLVGMPNEPAEYARALYSTMHILDERNLDVIICELPPDSPEWAGVRNRLLRAGKPCPA
jgi:L-threonylcarbamoyladenylate synthase